MFPQAVYDRGIALILRLQMIEGLIGPMQLFSLLGDEEFYLLFLPFLYWASDRRFQIRVGIYFAISVLVNELLKMGFHSPRPYWTSSHAELHVGPENSFGFPSGHTQHTVVLWGIIAYRLRKNWATVLAIVLALLVGLSRIVVGVHFPVDVFGAWLIGGVLLFALIHSEEGLLAWWAQRTARAQMRIVGLSGVLGIAAGLVVMAVVNASWTMPATWDQIAFLQAPEEILTPVSVETIITIMATWSSLLIGHIWYAQQGGFDPLGSIGKRVGRYVLGIVVVVIIWAGLDAAFGAITTDETVLGHVLRFIRYSAVGFFIGGLAPMLFVRLGLAERAK